MILPQSRGGQIACRRAAPNIANAAQAADRSSPSKGRVLARIAFAHDSSLVAIDTNGEGPNMPVGTGRLEFAAELTKELAR
jgi:hypothetical protein